MKGQHLSEVERGSQITSLRLFGVVIMNLVELQWGGM